jgi:biotin operon repressor
MRRLTVVTNVIQDCLVILRRAKGEWISAQVLANQTDWSVGTIRRHLKIYGGSSSIERRHAVGYRINEKFYAQK